MAYSDPVVEKERRRARARQRRKRAMRGRSIGRSDRVSRRELAALRAESETNQELLKDRPKTRGDCASVARPCPYAGCRYHLYLDANPSGTIRLAFPDLEPGELPPAESCALDVAEIQCGLSFDSLAPLLNLSREQVVKIEKKALIKIEQLVRKRVLDQAPECPTPKIEGDDESWSWVDPELIGG